MTAECRGPGGTSRRPTARQRLALCSPPRQQAFKRSSLRAISGFRRAQEWLESRPPGCSRSQTEPGQPAGSHRIGPEEGRNSPRTVGAVCSGRGFRAPAVPRTASRGAAVSRRKACPSPSGGVKWRTLLGVRRSRFVFSGPGLATEDSMWPDHGHSDHRQKAVFPLELPDFGRVLFPLSIS